MKPCAFYDWDEAAARDRLTCPLPCCEMLCGTCGFNPDVALARIEKVRQQWRNKVGNLSAEFS